MTRGVVIFVRHEEITKLIFGTLREEVQKCRMGLEVLWYGYFM